MILSLSTLFRLRWILLKGLLRYLNISIRKERFIFLVQKIKHLELG